MGVVGCGRNSDNHLRVYSHLNGVRIVAVCDKDLPKAEEKRRKYGADFAFAKYDSMLNLDLDLIDITTPTPSHSELSCLALETGHNVLVEKPMGLSSTECLKMIRAARKSGRFLCVSHNKLFFDCVTQAKAIVEHGGLSPSRMSITHHFSYKQSLERWRLRIGSGGLLWDALVHPIYLTQHFLGKTTSVYAAAQKINERVNDSFVIILQNRGLGLAEYIWNANQPLLEMRLIGRSGESLTADLVHDIFRERALKSMTRRSYALKLASEDLAIYIAKCRRYLRSFLEIGSYPGALPFQRTFYVLIGKYVSFLKEREERPPVSMDDGFQSVKVLEAAKKSIESGRPQNMQ